MNHNNANNSLFVLEKINKRKRDSLDLTMKNKPVMQKNSSSKELFSLLKKSEKI